MANIPYNETDALIITQSILKAFSYPKDHLPDLIQCGRLGYLEATKTFKPKKRTKFFSFAWTVIRNRLSTYLRSVHCPSHEWISIADIKTVYYKDGELDDDREKYQRISLPTVYNFGPDDEKEMLENMKKLFIKNWNEDYGQYRKLRNEKLEYYWQIILDRYHGLNYVEICKKNNITYKALDNILRRVFRCMRRQLKPSEVLKQNKNKPKKPKKKAKKKKTYDAEWHYKYGRRKNYRGLLEMI